MANETLEHSVPKKNSPSLSRYHSLVAYGIIIIATGIFLFLLAHNSSPLVKYLVATGMFLSAVFAFVTSYKSKKFQIPLMYHGLHAGGMLLYGLAVIFFAKNMEQFSNVTIFFLIYYGVTEIIFCLQILILRESIRLQVDLFRLIIGFLIGLGSILILSSSLELNKAFLALGVLLIFSGVNVILFRTVHRKLDQSTTDIKK